MTPDAATDGEDWQETQARLLFSNAPVGLVGNVLVGAALVALCWDAFPQDLLVSWLGALILTVCGRALLLVRFKSQLILSKPERWSALYAAGAACTGVVWGASALILAGSAETLSGNFVVFCLAGMSAAVVATSASYLPAVLAFNISRLILPSKKSLKIPALSWLGLSKSQSTKFT